MAIIQGCYAYISEVNIAALMQLRKFIMANVMPACPKKKKAARLGSFSGIECPFI
jgi:hypothetical protein